MPSARRFYPINQPNLPGTFAPLKSLNPKTNNLPVPVTSFIGCTMERAEVKQLPDQIALAGKSVARVASYLAVAVEVALTQD